MNCSSIIRLLGAPTIQTWIVWAFPTRLFYVSENKKTVFFIGTWPDKHEQNNVINKGTGGVVPFLNREDESASARWSLYASTNWFRSFQIMKGKKRWMRVILKRLIHHEDTRYSQDVCRLEAAIITNPFKMDKLTVLNQETASFNPIASLLFSQ